MFSLLYISQIMFAESLGKELIMQNVFPQNLTLSRNTSFTDGQTDNRQTDDNRATDA